MWLSPTLPLMWEMGTLCTAGEDTIGIMILGINWVESNEMKHVYDL